MAHTETVATLVHLDGNSLDVETLMKLSKGGLQVDLTEAAWERVRNARRVIDDIVASDKVVYGINTGFGVFADVRVPNHTLEALQENLIRSHAAGVGKNLNLEQTRAMMVLRINVLAKGHSGITEHTLRHYIAAFNNDCLSYIPCQGTLGASGDLAPLAHLALGLMGEGDMWNPTEKKYDDAAAVLQQHGLHPLTLKAKEGLALINGTQFIAGIGALAVARSRILAESADYICALTVEALRGTKKAFSPQIHAARPHPGQIRSAATILKCMHSNRFPSEVNLSHAACRKVQDAYSLRCAPQVHGVAYDTLDFVSRIIETEMNSATDNPMVFTEGRHLVISGGNFHGEFPAKALDFLAIAIHELSNISQTRVERLLNNHLSELPAFLVEEGGLNSGFMIAQCTAAALVSENKTLCHPSSVDSIPTSAEKEDHVSMGGWSARKCMKVVDNVENVLAIELLCAVQALDFLRPLRTTAPLETIYDLVRSEIPFWKNDRYMKPAIDRCAQLIREGLVIQVVHEVFAKTPEDPNTREPFDPNDPLMRRTPPPAKMEAHQMQEKRQVEEGNRHF